MQTLLNREAVLSRYDKFSEKFKFYRERAGYGSQQEFADKSGFSRVQVGRWESGSKPKIENMAAVVESLRLINDHERQELYTLAGYAIDSPIKPEQPTPGRFLILDTKTGQRVSLEELFGLLATPFGQLPDQFAGMETVRKIPALTPIERQDETEKETT